MLLKIDKIDFSYMSAKILDGVTFNAKSGDFLGIMGPNGSGKTTLLRCISKILSPQIGTVLIDGREIHNLSKKDIAKNIGVVPQNSTVDFDFTISEIVLMGRTPHTERFKSETSKDFKISENVMKLTNTLHLSERTFDELSGGERQRVIIARALAQEPKVFLLDEATVHLDISSKFEILNLVKNLIKQNDIIVIAVFHDLNLAAQYSDKLILLDKGKIVSIGQPSEVLTPKNIEKTYHIDAIVKRHAITNTPYVTPYFFTKNYKNKNEHKIHLICGGGSGSDIMGLLLDKGFKVTSGVLNVLDSDFEAANNFKIQVIGEIPFSEITKESHEKNIELIKKANFVIVTDFQIGAGNLKNIEAAEIALNFKMPVIVIDSSSISDKDFIGGNLETHFKMLKKNGAIFVKNLQDALNVLLNEVSK